MQKFHYGELPTRIRMMIMLLALVMVSEFMRLFSLTVFATLGMYPDPVAIAMPIAVFYGALWSLKKPTGAAPLGAVLAMAMGLLDDGSAIYSMQNMVDSYPVVAFWWPAAHLACYLALIAVVISPGARSFYRNAGHN